jgi:hypothetical protein
VKHSAALEKIVFFIILLPMYGRQPNAQSWPSISVVPFGDRCTLGETTEVSDSLVAAGREDAAGNRAASPHRTLEPSHVIS